MCSLVTRYTWHRKTACASGNVARALKQVLIAALLALMLLALTWTVSRVIYPTAAQREATAQWEREPDYEGENAFALLWTLNRAVPDEALEAVMAEDVQTFSAQFPVFFKGKGLPPPSEPEAVPSAADVYTDLSPGEEDLKLFCKSRQADCLQQVRTDLEAYSALVERHEQFLDRLEKLQDYGYVRSEFPYRALAPVPLFNYPYMLRTRHAVQFASGERQWALAATCRDLLTWRRLGSRADNLIVRLQADLVSSRGNGSLLAEMLAELPVDEPLPEVCSAALVPPAPEELSLCSAMREEFGASVFRARDTFYTESENAFDRLLYPLVHDPEATVGMSAEGFDTLCEVFENAGREPVNEPATQLEPQSLWRLACVSNLDGCVSQAMQETNAWPVFNDDYQKRVLDHGARLRALGTLAWMREQAGQGRSPEELLASRPAELNHPGDEMSFGPDGKTLRIALSKTRVNTARGDLHWSLPLPPALYVMPAP